MVDQVTEDGKDKYRYHRFYRKLNLGTQIVYRNIEIKDRQKMPQEESTLMLCILERIGQMIVPQIHNMTVAILMDLKTAGLRLSVT